MKNIMTNFKNRLCPKTKKQNRGYVQGPSRDNHLVVNEGKHKWNPQEKDQIKINFDEASKGNSGPSGVGFVIRDQK